MIINMLCIQSIQFYYNNFCKDTFFFKAKEKKTTFFYVLRAILISIDVIQKVNYLKTTIHIIALHYLRHL